MSGALIARLRGLRILVIGDLVLDEYVVGRASRLSREAPVPVLELIERFCRPGAACNPAANIAALGGVPLLIGVLGDDPAGRTLVAELARAGIETGHLISSPTRATGTKTRVLAQHAAAHRQQVARIDDLDRAPLAPDVESQLQARIVACVPSVDAILVSDYKGGVVARETIEATAAAARQAGRPIAVDSQGDLLRFGGFTLVKSNQPDAEVAIGRPLRTDAEFAEAGRRLVRDLGAAGVVITRGAEGMSVVDVEGRHTHLPAANRTEVWDVTGAGDTVIAVLTMGLAASASLLEAAKLANAAAGLVVRRLGVATVSPEELKQAVTAAPGPGA